MYVRLGFSVAINVDPDVLLVDEVLAVGDEAFQRKCNEKFADLKARGKTIVLVSHGMTSVHNICDTVAWLDHGRIKMVDAARKVVDEYVGAVQVDRTTDAEGGGERWGSGEAQIEEVELLDGSGRGVTRVRTGDAATVRLHYRFHEPVDKPVFAVTIQTLDGTHISGPTTRDADDVPDRLAGSGHVDLSFDRLMLLPGTYDVNVSIHDYSCLHPYDVRHKVLRFDVEPGEPHESFGFVALGGRWQRTEEP